MAKSYLIRNAELIQNGNPFHLQRVDVCITDGIITSIGKEIKSTSDMEIIEGGDLSISSGWVDVRCHLTDPGYEHRDELVDLLNTAASGGFTSLVTLPNSTPVIRDKASVQYLINASEEHVVNLFPAGALSSAESSENLAELFDMHNSGARAFTDGDKSISNGLLKKALLYVQPFGGTVMTHPSDRSLEKGGVVNESEQTIHTGLKTNPSLSEYLNVREQLEIVKYCDASLHFSTISCKESVDLIKEAKQQGLKVTCDVAIANLCFSDTEVLDFDENFKLYPPLRTEADRQALLAGVKDGTIDAICSNHNPQNSENKQMEFDYSEFGALSLQLIYPWYLKYLSQDLSKETFIKALSSGPSDILGIEQSKIAEGTKANITITDEKEEWVFNIDTNKSNSKNSHEWNQPITGKTIAVFNNQINNLP